MTTALNNPPLAALKMAFWGALCLVFSGASSSALAQQETAIDAVPLRTAPPVVVEMFLSQSCKNCPPAAAYCEELAERDDLVVLAWHVDYWNLFANSKTGRWQDPFSRASHADRQKKYNKNIRKRNTVFTPQAIVGGVLSIVGSKKIEVEQSITEARFIDEKAAATPPQLALIEQADNLISAKISGVATDYDVHLVLFYESSLTDVKGGDNAGMTLSGAHVVTEVKVLASQSRGDTAVTFAPPKADMGCAILVQEPGLGRIAAAQYCPGHKS